MYRPVTLLLLCAAAALPIGADTGFESRPASGESCLACGKAIEGRAAWLQREGREVWLHPEECVAAWEADPGRHFRNVQAKSALFDEEGRQGLGGYGWFLAGLWVLVGTICGAAAAYAAVGRRRSPIPWFFLGVATNGIALVAIWLAGSKGDSAPTEEVPPGLRKVPTTLPPESCPLCGSDNHPSARSCSRCDATLEPLADAETSRV